MTGEYTVIFERDEDGGYVAFCPALAGCVAEGDTLQEATENIRDAIALYLQSLVEDKQPIPIEHVRETVVKPIKVAVPA